MVLLYVSTMYAPKEKLPIDSRSPVMILNCIRLWAAHTNKEITGKPIDIPAGHGWRHRGVKIVYLCTDLMYFQFIILRSLVQHFEGIQNSRNGHSNLYNFIPIRDIKSLSKLQVPVSMGLRLNRIW